MQSLRILAAAAFFLTSLAGCLDGNGAGGDDGAPEFAPGWSERALPSGPDHDHTDPLEHYNATTPNFEVIGFDALVSPFYGTSPGGLHCGDARPVSEGRRLAVVESRSKVGFTVADVTDPMAPRYLGEMVMEGTIIKDVTLTPDGRYVVAVTLAQTPSDYPGVPTLPGDAGLLAEWHDCRGATAVRDASSRGGAVGLPAGPSDPIARPRSILLIDIQDPATPVIVDHQPLTGEGHSVAAFDVEGEPIILTSVYLSPLAYLMHTIIDTPAGGKLQYLSQYVPQTVSSDDLVGDVAAQAMGAYSHDGWIARHPTTGEWLAYLAALDALEIVNIDDPMRPTFVGSWTDKVPGREGFSGIIHSVEPLYETWDGHHYTVVGPEPGTHPVDHPTGILWVLDTTNPGTPFEVAAWTLPHELDWEDFGFIFATHYFTVVGKTLLVSMYHAGIWAVDLAPLATADHEEFVLLDSIGVFLPADPSLERSVFEDSAPQAPSLEEVLHMGDGTFVTFDNSYGLYSVRYHPQWPAPPPEPWQVEPVSKR